MSNFVNLLVYGTADGTILALAALGFVLIYKSTGVINFAQGEFLLVGAYTFYTAFVLLRLPFTVAVVFGAMVAIVLALIVERFILRPLIGESPLSVIMVTIGLSQFLRAIVEMFYGTSVREMPAILPTGSVNFLGGQVPVNRLLVIVVAAVVLTAFTIFFRRTRHGIAMRAVADDQQAALTMGISVRRIFALSWALAAVTAMIGGLLVANITGVSAAVAAFGLIVFPVVILGGLDSIGGTIVGGLIIGLLVQYTAGYVGGGLQEVVPYIVLVLILMFRPYGLFGEVRIERV